jgi:hypothetical protein
MYRVHLFTEAPEETTAARIERDTAYSDGWNDYQHGYDPRAEPANYPAPYITEYLKGFDDAHAAS